MKINHTQKNRQFCAKAIVMLKHKFRKKTPNHQHFDDDGWAASGWATFVMPPKIINKAP